MSGKKNKQECRDGIYAVVVCYYPDLKHLFDLLVVLSAQVEHIILINNGPAFQLSSDGKPTKFTVIESGDNIGVAAALNLGIEKAAAAGATYVLTLDQDSAPSGNMVPILLAAVQGLQQKGEKVAGVGPLLIDSRSSARTPFVRIKWFGVSRSYCGKETGQMCLADFLVTSGMLVPINVFAEIGFFETGLFIDNVDLEWCFRARSKGYTLHGICDAYMLHSVGDQVFRFGPFSLYRHTPLRQYYIMRNRLWLYRQDYAPVGWILQDAFRALFKVLAFSTVFSPRIENIRMMYRGVRSALAGRLGKYDG